jgi:type IV pilus assembly protein PilA
MTHSRKFEPSSMSRMNPSCHAADRGEQDGSRRARALSAGFTLMELLIVIAVALVLTVIAIPNLAHMKMMANENSAIAGLRSIYDAETRYQSTYPTRGFACSLAEMGGTPGSAASTPEKAQVLATDLASGQKSGYTFAVANCTTTTLHRSSQYSLEITAVPQAIGKTGHRGFCIDQSGEIKADPSGGTNCTQSLQ